MFVKAIEKVSEFKKPVPIEDMHSVTNLSYFPANGFIANYQRSY